MALPPSRNWYRPNATFYKGTANTVTINFRQGSNHGNSIICSNTNVNKLVIKATYTASYATTTNMVIVATVTSGGVLNQRWTFTKNTSATSTNYRYLYFIFYNGNTYIDHAAININSWGNGTYQVFIGGIGGDPAGAVSANVRQLYNIMCISDDGNQYTWEDMIAPIAYTNDYTAGSLDTLKSVILWNTTYGEGRAMMSQGYDVICPLWTSQNTTTASVTNNYTNNQGIRWVDIDEYNVTNDK